ncbi:MAG: Sapep family Mn(2+)-dependent dipeptidase, partial [Lachnospiraceae bacterium]|nr:Sapep family Mn(2+)-dependent dipeptidase [Lachnospiraceae bacterium]
MYREQLDQYIDTHKDEMLADIIELCKIDSAKGPYLEGKPFGQGPFEALMAGLQIGEKYGFATRNYDNYVGTIDLNDKEQQLDILAHLDIVPGGEGWTVTTPFEPVVKDGKIYGRGTSDDKGPAITALYAMRAIKELGIPVKKNVRLILGTDEECGSSDIAYYYKKEEEAPMTFSPDAAFPVINIEKGSLHGEFEAKFEKSDVLPRMVAFKSGTKVNVVPSKAYALFEGLDGSETEAFAKQFEAELGVKFDVTSENGYLKLEAFGESAHASTPEKGTNALTALLAMVEKLNLADCGQVQAVKALNKMMPHGDNHGKNLGINHEDEISGKLTLAFSMLEVTETELKGDFDSRC